MSDILESAKEHFKSKDMEEYFLKLGYTKIDGAVIKPKVFSNKAKYKINKEDK